MSSDLGTRPEPVGESGVDTDEDRAKEVYRRADIWVIVGGMICGTFVLGPPGLVCIAIGLVILRRAQKRGIAIRPWHVTIIGSFLLMDATANFAAWAMDVLPAHDTTLVLSMWNGWGKLVDGGYYIDYNAHSPGGTQAPGEKAFAVMGFLVMFPMRMAACWGFLRMRRWGFQMLVVTAWMQFMFWLGYHVNVSTNLADRFGASLYGVTGYWIYDIVYFSTPLLLIPYIYMLDRRRFTGEPEPALEASLHGGRRAWR